MATQKQCQESFDAMEPSDCGEFKCRTCWDTVGGCEECNPDFVPNCIEDAKSKCDGCGHCADIRKKVNNA